MCDLITLAGGLAAELVGEQLQNGLRPARGSPTDFFGAEIFFFIKAFAPIFILEVYLELERLPLLATNRSPRAGVEAPGPTFQSSAEAKTWYLQLNRTVSCSGWTACGLAA